MLREVSDDESEKEEEDISIRVSENQAKNH